MNIKPIINAIEALDDNVEVVIKYSYVIEVLSHIRRSNHFEDNENNFINTINDCVHSTFMNELSDGIEQCKAMIRLHLDKKDESIDYKIVHKTKVKEEPLENNKPRKMFQFK